MNSDTVSIASFCPEMRTFPTITTDWRQIWRLSGGDWHIRRFYFGVDSRHCWDAHQRESSSRRCRLWCDNHKAPRYKNIKSSGNESVRRFSRPLVTHQHLSEGRNFWVTFFFSPQCLSTFMLFQSEKKKGDSFCSARVSWCSRLKSLCRCCLFQAAIFHCSTKVVREFLALRVCRRTSD